MAIHPVYTYIIITIVITNNINAFKTPIGDSILDLMNTKEVERIKAEREENEAKNEKRYLEENDLDENYDIIPDIERQELLYHQPESNVFTPAKQENPNPRISIDLLHRQNNNQTDPLKKTELLHELAGFNARKILKGGKNALIVTKKEYLKKDWCKTEPLVQKIKEEGCLTRTIINRFCYGQCNSFYIPKNPKKKNYKHGKVNYEDEDDENDLNGAAFKSCAFCKPKKYTWITVTMRCPNQVPQLRKKRIQRIKQCKCMTEVLN